MTRGCRTVTRWGLAFWAAAKFAPQVILAPLGASRSAWAQLDTEERDFVLQVLQTLLPLGSRRAGLLNDMTQMVSLAPYPLERVTVPTLVIHAVDDVLVPFAYGQFTTQAIPGARLITLSSGGHLLVGRRPELATAMAEFMPA
jgi:pimeloyl-ACP methyl ester carboxylesterase